MTKREERGRLGTALLQPMAVYEAPKGESQHAMRDVHSGGGGNGLTGATVNGGCYLFWFSV